MKFFPIAERVAEHSFVPAWIKPGATVVDLGMNRGRFAETVRGRFGCRVLGVEPDPELAASNASRGLECRHAAIAPEAGEVRFRVDHADRTASRIADTDEGSARPGGEDGARYHTVPCLPLHRFLAEAGLAGASPLQLLKMDIEGAELALFEREPAETLARFEQISVEFHAFLDAAQGPRVEAILGAMAARGFHWVDFSLCRMDVLFINEQLRPLPAIARPALATAKWIHGARRRLGRLVSSTSR